MEHKLTCIICPRGCQLTVDDNFNVTGNSCPRGAVYGAQEIRDPQRTLTSTVKTNSKILRVCPVKTNKTIKKGLQFQVMEEVNKVVASVPIHLGDILVANIAGSGADLIATREILE